MTRPLLPRGRLVHNVGQTWSPACLKWQVSAHFDETEEERAHRDRAGKSMRTTWLNVGHK